MKQLLLLLAATGSVLAGDTYDCINAKGDYYAPRPTQNDQIVVAVDSARHELRYQPMLDERDLRHLIFIGAHRRETVLFRGF